MGRRYCILDVFTEEALSGNPLAVVLDSEGLDDAAMQAIAREFNLSETVFLLPALDEANRARLRIFTPARELPFAGHPTVGTAVLLGRLDGAADERLLNLEELIGTVRCRTSSSGEGGFATFILPMLPERNGAPPPSDLIAAALGLRESEIGFAGHEAPMATSAGVPYLHVPVANLETLARIRPDPSVWHQVFGHNWGNAYIYTASAYGSFRARMLATDLGATIVEDPATGSAAAAFAAVLMQNHALDDGRHAISIEQGYEMGRPSRIALGLVIEGGQLVEATVGGSAVLVAEGTLNL